MKNAVIYARYSSYNQTEMSIEGQLAECRRYAEKHALVIIQEYIDRAQSATTDKRPNFQRMIEDSSYGTFDIILVYQFDRFARNLNDAGYYRKILADNGVSVVSAMENIPNDSSGVITLGMIDAINQWYSSQLSEKARRGLRQRAELLKYNGGNLTYGFAVDENGYYILNETTAPIVKEIFERTAAGESGTDIAKDLNARGIRTVRGNKFGKNSFQSILRNERYKGTYVYDDIKIPDAIPRIVSDELFDEVQALLGTKARRGHRPAVEDYLLTGKLFCGHCKDQMIGTSGTSHTGVTYRYYTCANAPKKCDKKNVKKDFIESLILEHCRQMLSDEIINRVVIGIDEQNTKDLESPVIMNLKTEIKETEKKIDRLLDQMEGAEGSIKLGERLRKREEDLDMLNKQLMQERFKQRLIDPVLARQFLIDMRDAKLDGNEYDKLLINTMVDKIYLYDDRFRLLVKTSKKSKASKREAAEVERYFDDQGSSTALDAPPEASKKSEVFLFRNVEISAF